MARDDIQIDIGAKWSGEAAVKRASSQVEGLGRGISDGTGTLGQAKAGFQNLALGIGVAGAAYFAVSNAAKQAWAVMEQGAQLQTTIQRFDKLSESINTTGDALLGKLRTATRGMIDDASLMASASQIMSLGLADNEQQVTRLATVSGTLGWDMQQVILTFANLSTMRLDALGLSVEGVKTRAAELEKQGLSTAEAFKEAVIQAGEAKLDIGGVSEAEQSLKQATAAVTNFKNAILESTIATLSQAGAFEELAATANNIQLATDFRGELAALREEGAITTVEWLSLLNTLSQSGAAAAEVELAAMVMRDSLTDTDDEINDQAAAWQQWAREVSIATGYAAQQAAANMNAIFTGLVGISDGLGANGAFTPRANDFNYMARGAEIGGELSLNQRQAERMREAMRRSWAADDERAAQVERETTALRSYGGGLSYVSEEAQKAAEARQRFVSTFNEELRGKPEDGLINAEGVVNVEAMNSALYRQVEAAGASAATLALLGIATGQFSEEQAEAALKAAILQEQINRIAESVVSGKITLDQALASMGEASANLNSADLITVAQGVATLPEAERTVDVEANVTGAEAAVTSVQSSLAVLTDEPYLATLDADIEGILTGAEQARRALEGVPSAVTVTVNWNQVGGDMIGALMQLGIL